MKPRLAFPFLLLLFACEEDNNPRIEAAKAAQTKLLDTMTQRLAQCAGASAEPVHALLKIEPIGYVDIGKSVKAGRLQVDAAKIAECVAHVQQAPCDKVRRVIDYDDACRAVFTGQVRAEYACYSNFDCAPGSYCGADDLKCPAKCKAYGAEDQACNERDLCAAGLHCTCTQSSCGSRLCKKPGKKGDHCGKAEHARCGDDLFCVPRGAAGAGTCQPVVGLGKACPSTDACATPMKCIGLDSAQRPGKCQLPKQVGEPCTVGLRECTDLAVCSPKDGLRGVCTVWGGVGSPCGPLAQDREYAGCIGGYCELDGQPAGVCKTYKGKNEPCATGKFLDFTCGPGRCDHVMRKCVYPCTEP